MWSWSNTSQDLSEKDSVHIFFLTNDDDPHKSRSEVDAGALKMAEDLKNAGISLHLHYQGESFRLEKFYEVWVRLAFSKFLPLIIIHEKDKYKNCVSSNGFLSNCLTVSDQTRFASTFGQLHSWFSWSPFSECSTVMRSWATATKNWCPISTVKPSRNDLLVLWLGH